MRTGITGTGGLAKAHLDNLEQMHLFIKTISEEGGAISPYSDSVKTVELADAVMKAGNLRCITIFKAHGSLLT